MKLNGRDYEVVGVMPPDYNDLIERVRNTPGVQSAAVVTTLPLSGANNINTSFVIEGAAGAAAGQDLTADYRVASPDYFRTVGVPVQRGAVFTQQDTAQTPPKAVINETMARRYFASQDPVGSRITVDVPPKPVTFEIVGGVGDVKHFGLDTDAQPEIYASYLQQPWPTMTLVARTGNDPLKMAPAVRAVAGDPAILLADEPTGNLDSNNGESVMGLLRDLHRGGATICVVTHDPRYAEYADRAIHLFDGRVVTPGASVVPEMAAAVSA